MGDETWTLPSPEHPLGVYLGLAVSAFILGVGSAVLFLSIYQLFKSQGFSLSTDFLVRLILFFGSAYGAGASVAALYRMVSLHRAQVRKVEKEFKDFTVYARPLIEEVIRQRLTSQRLASQLEQLKKGREMRAEGQGPTRWYETLILIAILANISVGLYLYLDRYPWQVVPYSLIVLAFAWFLVIARHFEMLSDIRAWYVPAVYVLILPSLSIILRGYLALHQVLFLVFLTLVVYILAMYSYYSYVSLGQLPTFIPERFRAPGKGEAAEEGETPSLEGKLEEFLPPRERR